MSKTTTVRPPVELTVARWYADESRVKDDKDAWKSVMQVLDFHGASTNLGVVVYVCLECQSIGMTHDQKNRDKLVRNYDFSCCKSGARTVTFLTEQV